MKRKRAIKGILFILPSFIGVSIFWLIPYVDVIRRSFFGAVSGNFTGLKNYIKCVFQSGISAGCKKYCSFLCCLHSNTYYTVVK